MLLLYFFIIDFYFLIPAVIAQSFIPTAEPVMPSGTQTNEANAKTKTQLLMFLVLDQSDNLNYSFLFVLLFQIYICSKKFFF